MENKENKSKFRKEIEALSNVSIEGKLFDETPDTIVIQINNSLLEIHREDVANILKIQSDRDTNLVRVSTSGTAKITKRTVTTASQAAMGVATEYDDSSGYSVLHTFTINGVTYGIIRDDCGMIHIVRIKGPGPVLGNDMTISGF